MLGSSRSKCWDVRQFGYSSAGIFRMEASLVGEWETFKDQERKMILRRKGRD